MKKNAEKLNTTRGVMLFAMAVAIFVFLAEFSILGLAEATLHRVEREKNRISAQSLADSGVTYCSLQKSAGGGNPEKMFPAKTVKKSVLPGKQKIVRYRYTSPELHHNGFFELELDTVQGRVVKATSIGCSGPVKVTRSFSF